MLPLGVVETQLMRMEADLRFLNMKALVYAREEGSGRAPAQIAARLERITDALDTIRDLVSDILADVRPRPEASRKTPPDQDD